VIVNVNQPELRILSLITRKGRGGSIQPHQLPHIVHPFSRHFSFTLSASVNIFILKSARIILLRASVLSQLKVDARFASIKFRKDHITVFSVARFRFLIDLLIHSDNKEWILFSAKKKNDYEIERDWNFNKNSCIKIILIL